VNGKHKNAGMENLPGKYNFMKDLTVQAALSTGLFQTVIIQDFPTVP
jgi:hypothetical protein